MTRHGSASWRSGGPARICSPTGRPNTPLTSWRTPWPRTSPTAPPPTPSPGSAMTCWRPASPPHTRTPPPRWRRTGPTRKPGPGRRGTAPPAAPTTKRTGGTATPTCPAPRGEMFFGYYLSAGTMTRDENGPAVPGLARRMTLTSCALDPVRAFAKVLTSMPAAGVPLGDILDDSGYAHRDAEAWAIPLRQAGAQLVQDLHPSDRGPQGTHQGAIIANGNLYCPATPRTLLELGPLAPAATPDETAAHDQQTAELARQDRKSTRLNSSHVST